MLTVQLYPVHTLPTYKMDHSDTESISSSTSDSTNASPTSILSAEIKDLRNKIVCVKKSVTKGDKKQKKAVQDEISLLEALLAVKQEELKKLKSLPVTENSATQEEGNNERISKTKLKKERRKEEKAAEWEANRQAALAEIASRPDLALEESKAFSHRLAQDGFRIVEIAADGHCLFSAIGCQLDPPRDHWELRAVAAKYLLDYREEYENFIELDTNIPDAFSDYCQKLESTGMWGGQIELEALSRALEICIVVLQAGGPKLEFNEDAAEKQKIYLSYHRFAFSLGEHYNVLLKA